MAEYKYRQHLSQSDAAAFETRYAPGTKIANSGIYRCAGCGDEIAIPKNCLLPGNGNHPHGEGDGKLEWQLLVFAQRRRS